MIIFDSALSFCDDFLVVGSVPVITKQPVDSKFVRGKSGKLFCDTRGKPTPVVTWYKDDFPVNLGNKISQLNDNSLFFKKIRKRNDEGTYWCVAKNSEGEVRSKKVRVSVMCKCYASFRPLYSKMAPIFILLCPFCFSLFPLSLHDLLSILTDFAGLTGCLRVRNPLYLKP